MPFQANACSAKYQKFRCQGSLRPAGGPKSQHNGTPYALKNTDINNALTMKNDGWFQAKQGFRISFRDGIKRCDVVLFSEMGKAN